MAGGEWRQIHPHGGQHVFDQRDPLPPASGTIRLYVDGTAGSDAADGSSWATAWKTWDRTLVGLAGLLFVYPTAAVISVIRRNGVTGTSGLFACWGTTRVYVWEDVEGAIPAGTRAVLGINVNTPAAPLDIAAEPGSNAAIQETSAPSSQIADIHEFRIKGDLTTLGAAAYGTLQFVAGTRKIIRTVGSWLAAGAANYSRPTTSVTIAGSTANDGTYTVESATATDLTVAEALTDEIASADETVTGSVNIVICDVTSTGVWEGAGLALIGGWGSIAEPKGGSLSVKCGVDGNGNLVLQPKVGGKLYVVLGEGGAQALVVDASGLLLQNGSAGDIQAKDTGGVARLMLRGDAANWTDLCSLGTGIRLFTVGGGVELVAVTDSTKCVSIGNTGGVGGNSRLQVKGPISCDAVAKSADFNFDNTFRTARVTAGAGGVTGTLPTAVGIEGRRYTMVQMDGAGGTAKWATTGGQTINGAAGPRVVGGGAGGQWVKETVESDGANWIVVA